MTTATEELKKPPEKKTSIWTKEEKDTLKERYGSEIIVENGSLEDVNTKKAPTDAYIIQYLHEDKVHYDLTRGTKVTLFDMYWDKFKGGLKSINYGNGVMEHGGGLWCTPTVLTNISHKMRLMKEETFGPVIPIVAYHNIDEAIALANDTDFGLSAAVFCENQEEGMSVA